MNHVLLTDISAEILHNIFCFVEAIDLASLASTCRFIRDLITRDDLLWKKIYLTHFNEPGHTPSSWATTLQNLTQVGKLLKSDDHDLKRTHFPFLAAQILPLLLSTRARPTANENFLTSHFHHATRRSNASTLLRQASIFRRCGTPDDLPADSIALRQLSARLHVYSALPMEVRETEFLEMPGTQYIHPYARSRVYDLRRYSPANFWGPFMDDGSGRVDWEKVQTIYIVLGYGLRMLNERTGGTISGSIGWGMGLNGGEDMWKGLSAGSYKNMSAREVDRDPDTQSTAATVGSSNSTTNGEAEHSVDEQEIPHLNWWYDRYPDRREAEFQHQQAVFATEDPYGVKGTWMRIVNFLDYHDLFAFNFTNPHSSEDLEREPITTAEAFRLILIKLWVTKIEWPDEDEGQVEDWETIAEGSEAANSPAARRDGNTPMPDADVDVGVENNANTKSESQSQIKTETDKHPSPDRAATPSPSSSTSSLNGSEEGQKNPQPEKKKSKFPIVHFAGRSRSLHIRWDPNANSHIRGFVRAYPAPPTPKSELDNDSPNLSHIYPHHQPRHGHSQKSPAESSSSPQSQDSKIPTSQVTGVHEEDDLVIRWTTFSVFHGEERWRSEGVQIGGLKSARGILGNWFDKDFDPHGPAGPTGFWKMGDAVEMYGRKEGSNRIWGHDDTEDSD